ncbi:putative ferredoxin reductase [Arenicella chitinivorans]|uniref:Ferredoxin reductase n=1 Tax=Arenicella chitinivorans TaxID=1329800 RepID=A0A918VSH8_9GAMM|nr:FAD/NAD(P)-binding oxidoreductase [Arenicella chitinivorans]GHA20688.1 putative ferredoxin reductase [Arenicella chitinivorans]
MLKNTKQAIIIGGSHAAAQLSISLRQERWEGEILVVSDDSQFPYHRPPLSKDYLSGDTSAEQLFIRPASVYRDKQIEFLLNTRVEKIDRINKSVTLSNGEARQYDKLALCTGARTRQLAIPGVALNGVHYLRDLTDAEAIKQAIQSNGKAVIIGGGYIGLETAALLRKIGIDVCVLEAMGRVLQRVTAEEVSAFYHRVHTEEGVEIKTGVFATEIVGNDCVEGVVCSNGEQIDANLVIIGVGVIPNTELAEGIGLDVDDGVIVNEFAQTSDEHIVASGDCAAHLNLIYGRRIRLESVPNAIEQSKTAAASMCDREKVYNALPWFWSNQYDLRLQIAGLNQGFDRVVFRGDVESSRSFVAWYLKQGSIVAADCVNRPAEFILAKKLISSEKQLPIADLANDSIDAKTLLLALA